MVLVENVLGAGYTAILVALEAGGLVGYMVGKVRKTVGNVWRSVAES
jgi:hypothetical protein